MSKNSRNWVIGTYPVHGNERRYFQKMHQNTLLRNAEFCYSPLLAQRYTPARAEAKILQLKPVFPTLEFFREQL